MILCPGDEKGFLPPRYFRRAVHIKKGEYTLYYRVANKFSVVKRDHFESTERLLCDDCTECSHDTCKSTKL